MDLTESKILNFREKDYSRPKQVQPVMNSVPTFYTNNTHCRNKSHSHYLGT